MKSICFNIELFEFCKMDKFEIRYLDSKKGKAMIAKSDIGEDETILEEEPVVSCQFAWNEAYRYLACNHCLRPLETIEENIRRLSAKPELEIPYAECGPGPIQRIPCESCDVVYCSQTCKETAYNIYHKSLCHRRDDPNHPLVQLVEFWKQIHYPPESMNIMLLLRLLAYIEQSADPQTSAARVHQFCHRAVSQDQELVHKLLGDKFASQIANLFQMVASCMSGEYIQQFLTHDGFISLMALIGTNGQGIGSSPIAQWIETIDALELDPTLREDVDQQVDAIYQLVEEESSPFLNTEGSGLYELQSACNHSCQPNAEVHFCNHNHRLRIRAMAAITAGEEICISYLDACMLKRSRHSRQKELASNYLFICSCSKCESECDQADQTSEEDQGSDMDDSD